jgi:hypothetical protein
MSWNGSGTYTRGYASWSNDAANGLAISATKFDLEDNDFAAGIQNCLTIDGQSKPNTTLTWAQALALSKGSDATVFSLARSGGSNNPTLTWAVADATGFTQTLSFGSLKLTMASGNSGYSFATGAYSFGNTTDNPTISFLGSGNFSVNGAHVTIAAPSSGSGYALATTGVAGTYAGLFQAANSANQSFGLQVIGGTSASDIALRVQIFSGTPIFEVRGDGVVFGNDGTNLIELGYKDLPQNLQTISYQLVLADRGKGVDFNGVSLTCTIPANASVAFPVGTTIVVGNLNASSLSIAITTDTLTLAGTTTTGTRTLLQNGQATLRKVTSTSWLISGAGVT